MRDLPVKKSLYILPGGGLGNRLLVVSSIINLVRDYDIENVVIYWKNHNECGCDFEDIISELPIKCTVKNVYYVKENYGKLISELKIGEVFKKLFLSVRNSFFIGAFRNRLTQVNSVRLGECSEALKEKFLSEKDKKIYIETCEQFYGDLDLSKVKFNKEVVSKFNGFKDRVGSYDAMHIRRTDHADAIHNSPTALFMHKADEIIEKNKNARIYLASDDTTVISEFKEKYPDNIVSEAADNVTRLTSDGIRYALYEMMLLSGAQTLYASYGSTFSLVANSMGKNKMVVLKK
nr:hypothetical protein [uncultured Butyrivibrio sp.]